MKPKASYAVQLFFDQSAKQFAFLYLLNFFGHQEMFSKLNLIPILSQDPSSAEASMFSELNLIPFLSQYQSSPKSYQSSVEASHYVIHLRMQ